MIKARPLRTQLSKVRGKDGEKTLTMSTPDAASDATTPESDIDLSTRGLFALARPRGAMLVLPSTAAIQRIACPCGSMQNAHRRPPASS